MAKIYYYEVDDFLRKEDKYKLLEKAHDVYGVDWIEITPDKNHTWLTDGMADDWEDMAKLDGKNFEHGIFNIFSRGVISNGDAYVYNYDKELLLSLYKGMVENYNIEYDRWRRAGCPNEIEEFIIVDETKLKWIRNTKRSLKRGIEAELVDSNIRTSLYRPFNKRFYNFDRLFNEDRYRFPKIFPAPETEKENLIICVSGVGSSKPFHALMVNLIPCLDMLEKTQCFPFYIYNEDGTGRKENVSDWGLEQFVARYSGLGNGDSGFGDGEFGKNFSNINGAENGENQELQGSESVAGSDGTCKGDLPINKGLSKRGALRTDISNTQSSSINPIEHSRGTRQKAHEGIPLPSFSSSGIIGRVGDTTGNSLQSELHEGNRVDYNDRKNSESGSNVGSFNESTEPMSSEFGDGYSGFGDGDNSYLDSLNPNTQPQKPKTQPLTKWDIFYYIYGVLHKPEYRYKYAANLKRELPRIPFYDDFWKYSEAGKKLADLHVNYEDQPEYPLEKIEKASATLDWKVVKMKYNKDKTVLIYNDFLTLAGIPPQTFEYKLGNRSALDWIVDQYRVKTDKRSGIVNDPNRDDEPDYIVKLIGKIITVSLETVKIVEGLRGGEDEKMNGE
jgi:predicted helicase